MPYGVEDQLSDILLETIKENPALVRQIGEAWVNFGDQADDSIHRLFVNPRSSTERRSFPLGLG